MKRFLVSVLLLVGFASAASVASALSIEDEYLLKSAADCNLQGVDLALQRHANIKVIDQIPGYTTKVGVLIAGGTHQCSAEFAFALIDRGADPTETMQLLKIPALDYIYEYYNRYGVSDAQINHALNILKLAQGTLLHMLARDARFNLIPVALAAGGDPNRLDENGDLYITVSPVTGTLPLFYRTANAPAAQIFQDFLKAGGKVTADFCADHTPTCAHTQKVWEYVLNADKAETQLRLTNLLVPLIQKDFKGHNGYTPLHYVALFNEMTSIALIDQLLRIGIDVNARTDNGDTALKLARRANHFQAAFALQDHGGVE